ncbi:MAG: ATP-binding protein, partial [Peptococcaceae bacterium]|nr:ATP-binding protein [Peptococcaceae bacterium]
FQEFHDHFGFKFGCVSISLFHNNSLAYFSPTSVSLPGSIIFYTASNLVNELAEAQHAKELLKLEKMLSRLDLLIVDELSYLSFNRHQAELLFHILSERNERGSVIITTNLEFSRWSEFFPDAMLTAALVDRLTHKAHILDMNGPSYRLQERIKKTKPKNLGGDKDQV